ncbi:hypothetical protein MKW98_026607 [Papaver atlanticum]|uniref:SAM domain-containing protein n=1 Tax=Papaver atlanticum TaxID=357466 RepID=A0AAD4X5B3_9MAGN|nr:hypothetical protein MKW98_026607 [Papaver atlanticum]
MEGGGKSVALPLKHKNSNNNIKSVLAQLQTKWGGLEKGFQGWVSFTSGYMFQVVRSIPSPEAVATGLLLAVCQGLVHEWQVRSNLSQLEDTRYTKTRFMLSNLGLQNYENNFKKNLLTDNTIPLLKEIDLEKAGIPLGPRILIVDHIKRCGEAEYRHQARP